MSLLTVSSIEYSELVATLLKRRFEENGSASAEIESSGSAVSVEFSKEAVTALARFILYDLKPCELARLSGLLPAARRERSAILAISAEMTNESVYYDDVVNALTEYARENALINVEGFLRFRIPFVLEDWAAAIDRAGEEFLLCREYASLLKLLDLIGCGAPYGEKALCLILHEDGSCVITDRRGARIECESIEAQSLVALLVCFAPEKLEVYDLTSSGRLPILRTIRNVFGERAEFFVVKT
ncbi:MAG: hypothetical protein IJM18_08625 [Clostridia bacterium]|nr:hypothetical protein [Clostridia bacterium]